MKTSTSLFARALATENIFVNFDTAAESASFDLKSRTLTIPDWKASDSLRDMIVAHEVAHALYTPAAVHESAVESAKQKKLKIKGFCACLNVIEDARIERMIKEKFPGCRRDFYEGYKEILDKDIFDLNGVDLGDMSIVDKINLHFKFGILNLMTVPLNEVEKKIIDRVNRVKTYEEVIELATELYELMDQEMKQKQQIPANGMGGEENFKTDLDDALGTLEREGVADPGDGKENYSKFPYSSYPLPRANSDMGILSYKDLFKEIDHKYKFVIDAYKVSNPNAVGEINTDMTHLARRVDEFRKATAPMVRELVMQFERRKAAEEIQKERLKNSGDINPDKLHQYKTHDDIFLRNLVKYEGKKHGMVMLIDWSGSMADCLDGVIRQVFIMTWFCRKAKIPYEVFLYTEQHERCFESSLLKNVAKKSESLFDKVEVPEGFELSPVCLRHVFSSDMSDEDTRKMENFLWMLNAVGDRAEWNHLQNAYGLRNTIPHIFDLHGTPTNEALMMMHDYIPKFRAAKNIDIVDFMLITDGEPTGLAPHGKYAYTPVKGVRVQHLPTGRTLHVKADKFGYPNNLNLEIQYFLVDELRKLGAVTVGFSIGGIGGLHYSLVRKFVAPNLTIPSPRGCTPTEDDKVYAKYNAFYKKENFLPAEPMLTPGFDEYYIVRPIRPETGAATADLPSNATLVRIRNNFLKNLNSRKHSRIFLSRFIDLIAGRKLKKFKMI